MKNYKKFDRIVMAILSRLSIRQASQYIYWRAFRKKLDLKNPQTFDENLMYLKIYQYTSNPLITQCIDKYQVREYIKKCGCEELLIPLLGVWKSVSEIDFEKLPDDFVIKCNHGCGYNIICHNKYEKNEIEIKKRLNKWMKEDFWLRFGESNYRDIPKRILAEAYIGTSEGILPIDYKFYCFHGHAEYVMVCCERVKGTPKFYFYNRNWELQRINQDGIAAPVGFTMPKPAKLAEMFSYADKLAKPFPFVRVDLYETDTQIKFGELTFTPSAALDTSRLPQADKLFCDLLKCDKLE